MGASRPIALLSLGNDIFRDGTHGTNERFRRASRPRIQLPSIVSQVTRMPTPLLAGTGEFAHRSTKGRDDGGRDLTQFDFVPIVLNFKAIVFRRCRTPYVLERQAAIRERPRKRVYGFTRVRTHDGVFSGKSWAFGSARRRGRDDRDRLPA